MKTFKIEYWTGSVTLVDADSATEALESVYGPITDTGYTAPPAADEPELVVWWYGNDELTEVKNYTGDVCATVTQV